VYLIHVKICWEKIRMALAGSIALLSAGCMTIPGVSPKAPEGVSMGASIAFRIGDVSFFDAQNHEVEPHPASATFPCDGLLVKCGDDSQLTLSLTNGALLTIGEHSSVRLYRARQAPLPDRIYPIDDLRQEPTKSRLEIALIKGEVAVQTPKLKSGSIFRIITRRGVLSAISKKPIAIVAEATFFVNQQQSGEIRFTIPWGEIGWYPREGLNGIACSNKVDHVIPITPPTVPGLPTSFPWTKERVSEISTKLNHHHKSFHVLMAPPKGGNVAGVIAPETIAALQGPGSIEAKPKRIRSNTPQSIRADE